MTRHGCKSENEQKCLIPGYCTGIRGDCSRLQGNVATLYVCGNVGENNTH
jgi:hypothetical protein